MGFIPSSKMKYPKSIRFWLIIGLCESGKAFLMKLYYLQCKQFQFVDSMLFGQVG